MLAVKSTRTTQTPSNTDAFAPPMPMQVMHRDPVSSPRPLVLMRHGLGGRRRPFFLTGLSMGNAHQFNWGIPLGLPVASISAYVSPCITWSEAFVTPETGTETFA